MFSDIASIRAELKTRLEGINDQFLDTFDWPVEWHIVDHISEQIDALTPVLYIVFTGFSGDVNGQPLGRNQVACQIDLVVQSMSTDDEAGENQADEYVRRLCQVLQHSDDLWWDTARKERLAGGQISWRISTTALSTHDFTTEE